MKKTAVLKRGTQSLILSLWTSTGAGSLAMGDLHDNWLECSNKIAESREERPMVSDSQVY